MPSGGKAVPWLPIVAFALLHFMSGGAYMPYLQLHYQQRGVSAVGIGALTAVGPAFAVVIPLVWGLLGDRSGQVRRLLALTSFLAVGAFFGLAAVWSFRAMFLLSALFSAFALAGGPLGTALILSEADRLGSSYGLLRMWGSIGFAVGILGAGRLVESFGTVSIFSAYALPALLSLIPLACLPESGVKPQPLTIRRVWQALGNRHLHLILIVSLLWRVTSAAYYTFFSIYLDGMGAGATLISAAWAMGLVGEVAVLRLSGRLVGAVGVKGLLLAGLGGSAFRWLAYSLCPAPEWTLPFQLLHGLTFGATTTGAILAVDRVFPVALRSTGQGMLNVVMWGAGGLLGSLLAGLLFQAVGIRWLFGLSAAGAAVTALLTLLAWDLPGFAASETGKASD